MSANMAGDGKKLTSQEGRMARQKPRVLNGENRTLASESSQTQKVAVGGVDLTEYLDLDAEFKSMTPMERFLKETSRVEQLSFSEEELDQGSQALEAKRRS
jgi:hypothetical protein